MAGGIRGRLSFRQPFPKGIGWKLKKIV